MLPPRALKISQSAFLKLNIKSNPFPFVNDSYGGWVLLVLLFQ